MMPSVLQPLALVGGTGRTGKEGVQRAWVLVVVLPPRFFVSRGAAARPRPSRLYLARGLCYDGDGRILMLECGHAMCEPCMGNLAVSQGQTVTRSRRRVVIQCPLRCQASTERVLA